MDVKYIKTKQGKIIVFSCLFQHSDFKSFEPISAGFIRFGTNKEGNVIVYCYGESISLNLKANEEDSEVARRQILGMDY